MHNNRYKFQGVTKEVFAEKFYFALFWLLLFWLKSGEYIYYCFKDILGITASHIIKSAAIIVAVEFLLH
jgi:hypothetical protein